jgi:hypothetical protein
MKKKARGISLFNKWFPIISVVGSVVCTGIGGLVGWSVWITKNVPQISYVDEHFKKSMDYTDMRITELTKQVQLMNIDLMKQLESQSKAVTEDAHNWSNANKASIMVEFNKQVSTLAAKQDMLIDELRMIRPNQAYEQGRFRR